MYFTFDRHESAATPVQRDEIVLDNWRPTTTGRLRSPILN